MTLFNLWDQILDKKEHISIIIDEYGGLDLIILMI
jgi:CBS domain containing-hemolysin-like protein